MSKPSTLPRHGNARLSLECKPEVKDAIVEHGKFIGEWSLVGSIRKAIERSNKLLALQRRGTLVLVRDEDGEIEDVEI